MLMLSEIKFALYRLFSLGSTLHILLRIIAYKLKRTKPCNYTIQVRCKFIFRLTILLFPDYKIKTGLCNNLAVTQR